MRDHPLVRRGSPPDVAVRQKVLHDEQPVFLHALSQLPQTLCHRDPTPRNVIVRPGKTGVSETVALDWAMVGIAPLGRNLGSLVPAGAHSRDIDPAQLRAVDAVAFPAYVEGLRESGWAGDEAVARFGYCACAALRYGLLVLGVAALDDNRRDGLVRSFGMPIEELLDLFAEEQRFLMDLIDEARSLLPAVSHRLRLEGVKVRPPDEAERGRKRDGAPDPGGLAGVKAAGASRQNTSSRRCASPGCG
jgi:hypothetical protein